MMATTDRTTTETMAETEVTSNNQGMIREIRTTQTGMTTTKIETGMTSQVIFEFSDQNVMEMMQMVRGFINLIKANPTTREQYKSNKLATRRYDNEVNESEIQSTSLEQVQQFFNEDLDIIFDALVVADYIDEIECTDSTCQQQA